jgi:YfiH family protein
MARTVEMRADAAGGLTLHRFGRLAGAVDVAVTDRFGGVSEGEFAELNLGGHVGDDPMRVAENRSRVAAALGAASLCTVRQVHGAEVAAATDCASTTQADAIYVDEPAVAAAILVADCVPIALVDEERARVALVHAGWRGLAAGVIAAALSRFASPRAVMALIGPSVSPESYQVGPEVAERFTAVAGALAPDTADRSRLDLRAVAVHQLHAAGVSDDDVLVASEVTDGGEVYFSDRAQRPCGRFAMVATVRT